MSLKLSPQHGANPSLSTCFWCGEDDGSIILMGRLPNDEPAPRKVCASYEPCPDCQAKMALGITFMEATETIHGPKPTGRWMVVKPEAIERLINDPELATQILHARKTYVEPAVFRSLQP